THATSRCKVSKKNCAEILGIKLKPSHSKSIFCYDVDGCKLPCPTGRKLAYYSTMAAQRYNNRKVNNNYLMLCLALVIELVPDKAY
ncbi:hypothetical protein CXF74_03120, partial [Psychromonas sp. Urea-02u-13]